MGHYKEADFSLPEYDRCNLSGALVLHNILDCCSAKLGQPAIGYSSGSYCDASQFDRQYRSLFHI